jgi:hypothetical protein
MSPIAPPFTDALPPALGAPLGPPDMSIPGIDDTPADLSCACGPPDEDPQAVRASRAAAAPTATLAA